VVERGDPLESIALKYFNDRAAWPKIQAANRDRLGDGQPLPAGMRLVIPED
jgi:nucleoid-associated protein YgaU